MYMFTTIARASLVNLILNPLFPGPRVAVASAVTTNVLFSPRIQANLPIHPRCSASHLYSTMPSSPDPQPTSNQDQNQQPQEERKEYLALPDTNSAASSTQLDVSGDGSTVKLDHLGPLVVNQDGSLSRISNWEQMTEIERTNTLRVLGKRNKSRLDALKKNQAEAEGQN
ncbi:hypothetical protein BO70DRAFT_361131 [Aspergillus heteromorphus CBS 117.55]|uniref:Fungal specific transcription factor n=1 Tax=Aspergillus heteromorphus CBS 117.55 TaxID=1448321 RepID=A0A317WJ06_9EURO|nr:uncharacterized protein BO70DRAFT_361131 [Aspergillus heteromorphus CBS 117.55]PWY86299.1 hypothetical protein BO70DRAFT_361131 [Aspergillus heteromorphus CBS 117.55]